MSPVEMLADQAFLPQGGIVEEATGAMQESGIEAALSASIEDLAAAEHERWAHWQRYMHDHGTRQRDGSLVLPAHLVAQWDRQIATPYADLTEEEKESDREQVRRYLPIIATVLRQTPP